MAYFSKTFHLEDHISIVEDFSYPAIPAYFGFRTTVKILTTSKLFIRENIPMPTSIKSDFTTNTWLLELTHNGEIKSFYVEGSTLLA
jgi:hypothetical protein